MWKQFLPLQRAEAYNANIHQTTEKKGATEAAYDIKTPDSRTAPKRLSLLSSTLSNLARLFSHLLRRPPPEALQRRPDFSLLLPSLPAAGPARGRLSLLLWAALTLPGRPSGGRSPREEDASAGQRSSMPLMGSERREMQKRQMSAAQETSDSLLGQQGVGNRGSNACCFCWCCCCSCSCLTVRNQDQGPGRASHELRRDDFPTWEESEREEKEKYQCESITLIDCLLYNPYWESSPQPRHVPDQESDQNSSGQLSMYGMTSN
ncbi:Regulator of G-protein signaling 20 [Myotis davidii]|uniref:Regulator of G-protein signaling 20 n=1 Tax=Myotis davidii TaxID=225400 RepID=L5LIM1_MYODS|nr:Regulator of G-protein signaling 20 [Myotis davidii]